MFLDRVKLHIIAGKGGDGIVSWERKRPRMRTEASGGNGGLGASVFFEACDNCFSLESFRNRRFIRAPAATQGAAAHCTGASAQDFILQVPCGTLIRDIRSGELLCDLVESGQRFLLSQGGKGGRGNASFVCKKDRAPAHRTVGEEGEEREIELELKVLADLGFVGLPNVGKSSLFHSITGAPTRIAAYPFSTLAPHLAVKEFADYRRIVFADIPGLVEGAEKDKGLGFAFLRHVERTHILIFVLDASEENLDHQLELLEHEIAAYSKEILEKPRLLWLNKTDLPGAEEAAIAFSKGRSEKVWIGSARDGEGVEAFVEKIYDLALPSLPSNKAFR